MNAWTQTHFTKAIMHAGVHGVCAFSPASNMSAYHADALELFSGGVPPGPILKINVDNLRRLVKGASRMSRNTVRELCLIGILSYFEGFCKDLFASCINIYPQLVERLEKRSIDISIDARRVLDFGDALPRRLGFLIAEKHDFGSAQQVNAHFTALLLLTPFGRDESKTFDRLLADRNLIVHHGGVFTSSYASQRLQKVKIRSSVYFDSLVIERATLNAHFDFIENIAMKMLNGSYAKLNEFVCKAGEALDTETAKAIDYLRWYE